ncbi:MAG: ferritin [Gemmatimonadota bacterium]|nr:ferritin [Gemmatimonadota bacterium]
MPTKVEGLPTKAVQAAINDQIAKEFYASYLYLSMAAWFEEQNLPGFAKWMRHQHDEEREHAMRFFDYLIDAGARVRLQGLDEPPADFKGPLHVMEASLAHEKKVTASIRTIYELAVKDKDYATQLMLQWFIKEQQEEEKSVGDVIARMKLAGDSSAALLFLDNQLGQRGPAAE